MCGAGRQNGGCGAGAGSSSLFPKLPQREPRTESLIRGQQEHGELRCSNGAVIFPLVHRLLAIDGTAEEDHVVEAVPHSINAPDWLPRIQVGAALRRTAYTRPVRSPNPVAIRYLEIDPPLL